MLTIPRHILDATNHVPAMACRRVRRWTVQVLHKLCPPEQSQYMSENNKERSSRAPARRRRSVRGQTPPRINDQLAATAAVITAATHCCPARRGRLSEHVEDVAGALHGNVVNVPAAVCAAVDYGHSTTCTFTSHDAYDLYMRTVTLLKLPDLIDVLKSDGIDAERLTWNLIVIESTRHIGLIRNEIKKLLPHLPPTDPNDLLGYGWRGLRMALRQYDPDTGNALATFACPKINGAIRDGIRSEHHLPKRLTTFSRRVSRTSEELTARLSRTPTYSEIADELDLAAKERSYLPHLPAPASLEEMFTAGADDGPRYELRASENNDVDVVVETGAQNADLKDAFDSLDCSSQTLLTAMYVDGKTLRSAARSAGISYAQAHTVHEHALGHMRELLHAWDDTAVPA